MQASKINIKNKIINHLMLNGEKEISKKILLKSLKEIYKMVLKQPKNLINLSIIFITPIFKVHKIIKKRKKKRVLEVPSLINSNDSKFSSAIKFLLSESKNQKKYHFYIKLYKKILSSVQDQEFFGQAKNVIQKQVLAKKHIFYYYRWK